MLAAYGQKRKTAAERPKHHLIGGNQHVVALYNRVASELMVLGFVAFVVWVLELPSDSQIAAQESLSHSCQPHSCQPPCLVCVSSPASLGCVCAANVCSLAFVLFSCSVSIFAIHASRSLTSLCLQICYKSEFYNRVADDLALKYNSAPDYYFLYNEV